MQRYLNARTIAIAVLAVVAVVAVYPPALGYLPLLLLAGCPLMMFFMHGRGGHRGHESTSTRADLGEYVCPMHSEVRSTFRGDCPICGMALEATTRASSGRGENR